MTDAVQFTLSNGTAVTVSPATTDGIQVVGLSTQVARAEHTLSQALAPISSAASDMIDALRAHAHRPDEVEVNFGVVLDAKLGGIIVGANTGIHLNVTLRWNAAARSGAATADTSGDAEATT